MSLSSYYLGYEGWSIDIARVESATTDIANRYVKVLAHVAYQKVYSKILKQPQNRVNCLRLTSIPETHPTTHSRPIMANIQSTQAFYSLTLEASSATQSAVTCNVIPGLKTQDQQIFEACGQRIRVRRIHENADRSEVRVSTVVEQDVFGIVRGVSAFRIPGTSTGKS